MTPFSGSLRRMEIFWGVDPYLMPNVSNTDERIQVAEAILKRQQLAKRGDRIVILSGEHGQKLTGANLMKIHEIH
ncbi:MAG: hypothetical protein NPIRA05_16520 [Nitrospirales bacterium]|nr:MAG: hypothetical protein NPIRA05_16520 [Nitrospirales bacterium]